jgi:hypothetical protein
MSSRIARGPSRMTSRTKRVSGTLTRPSNIPSNIPSNRKTIKRKRSNNNVEMDVVNKVENNNNNVEMDVVNKVSEVDIKPKQNNPCDTKTASDYDKLKKILSQNNIEEGKKDLFNCIIMNNSYVDVCVRNSQRDPNSFYSLIARDLSQSDAIKLGIAIEKIFVDIILTNPQLKNIRKPNQKGNRETDHLFLNETNKTVYYAEVKGNLQLDTEKKPETIKKIQGIIEKLKQDKYNVKSFLFAPRYYSTSVIPKKFIDSYKGIILIGVNEYLEELGVQYQFANEDVYKKKLNYLAYRMFKCISIDEIYRRDIAQTALGSDYLPKIPDAPRKPYRARSRTNLSLPESPSGLEQNNELSRRLSF